MITKANPEVKDLPRLGIESWFPNPYPDIIAKSQDDPRR